MLFLNKSNLCNRNEKAAEGAVAVNSEIRGERVFALTESMSNAQLWTNFQNFL